VTFLLDTSIAIHVRDGTPAVVDKLAEADRPAVISALTYVELQRGLYRDPSGTTQRRLGLEALLRHIPVVPFDRAAAEAYGRIIAQRGWDRRKDYDRMIAAHAIMLRAILVTDNVADIQGIPGLSFVRWVVR
jgi:tRNA(fMet)-specific endonuclease VapC